MTVTEMIESIENTWWDEYTIVHSVHCPVGSHDQLTVTEFLGLIRRWPGQCTEDDLPTLICGCFDPDALEAGALPPRLFLGMGIED